MTTPAQRGRDPQPMGRGGEVALVGLCGVLLLLALAALAGLGLAAALFGSGWVWPDGNNTTTSSVAPVLVGLLQGHPGAGLPAAAGARVPGPTAVYATIAVVELFTVATAVALGLLFWRYHRPSDARRGMATRDEAAQILGTGRLYVGSKVLRPDLHAPAGRDSRDQRRGVDAAKRVNRW